MRLKITRQALKDITVGITMIDNAVEVRVINGKDEIVPREYPIEFEYFIERNRKLLKGEVEAIDKTVQEKTKEFNDARLVLAEKHAKKDQDGKPKTINRGLVYDIIDPTAFDKEVETLKGQHKAVLDEVEDFLKGEIEVEAYSLDISRVLALTLPKGSFAKIKPLLKE